MPLTRPTLTALVDATAAEVETRLPGILARVRRSLAGVFARVLAGGLWGLYGYAEDLDRQKWPDLCDGAYLDWHGLRWGVTRKAAQAASGTVRFTGVDTTAVPIGTVVQRADGVQYATTAAGAIAVGEALIAVEAVLAGGAGNSLINTAVILTTPIGGVNSVASSSTALAAGSDLEGDDAYRARILLRVRKVPHAGAKHDYEQWALDVQGVTRAWVYPLESGDGTVTVRFVRDGDPGIIPDVAEVAAVQAYIDSVRPVTAIVTVVAPAAQAIDYTIHLITDTADIRAAISEELDNLTRGTDNMPGGTILISHIREAISTAVGETDHVLFAPLANIVLPANTMATHGVITWT
jgi:uncharacterized phage protein gp47/JayE